MEFRDIIGRWPSNEALAADVGVKRGHPAIWKHRNNIPARYWAGVVAASKRRGIDGVSVELLAEIAASTPASVGGGGRGVGREPASVP